MLKLALLRAASPFPPKSPISPTKKCDGVKLKKITDYCSLRGARTFKRFYSKLPTIFRSNSWGVAKKSRLLGLFLKNMLKSILLLYSDLASKFVPNQLRNVPGASTTHVKWYVSHSGDIVTCFRPIPRAMRTVSFPHIGDLTSHHYQELWHFGAKPDMKWLISRDCDEIFLWNLLRQ